MNNKNTIYKIIYCCSKHKILISNYYREAYVTSTGNHYYAFLKTKKSYCDFIEFDITKKEIRYCFLINDNNNYFLSSLKGVDEFKIPYWLNDLKMAINVID